MKRVICAALLVLASIPLLAGCPGLNLGNPDTVTVVLRNNSDFAVEVEVRTSSQQEIPEDFLESAGDVVEYTIPAGQSRTFTQDCDDLQAILIADADLMVIGQVGPSTSTNILRDGTHFGCGDTIQFTFDHSDLILDFGITIDVID